MKPEILMEYIDIEHKQKAEDNSSTKDKRLINGPTINEKKLLKFLHEYQKEFFINN